MADFGGRGPALSAHIDADEAHHAATMLRRVARRLHAPQTDLDAVMATVFAETATERDLALPQAKLTAEQKDRARVLFAAGLGDTDIAHDIGAGRQQVSSLRGADKARAAQVANRQAGA